MARATTIQISIPTKHRLERLKDYARETYEDVINKLIDILAEEQMELSEATKKEIEDARREFRAGRGIPFEKVLEKAGLK